MWIDNRLAYKLLENAVGDNPDDPPDFSPESDFGEGSTPTWEDEYRSQILLLLSTLFLAIRDTVKDPTMSPEQMRNRINILVESFVTQGEGRIGKDLSKINQIGRQAASQEILSIGLYPGTHGDERILRYILDQQRGNLRYVANAIRDNAYGQINWKVLQDQYKTPAQFKYNVNMNQAFKEGKTRLDRMASYGATAVYAEGKLTVFREYEDSILINWMTRGDSKVCPTCRFFADQNPYKPSEFPAPPHTGCRCYPTLATEDVDGNDLLILPIIDTLVGTK